ncbi:hypothetical protein [Niallia sp. Krafla_26]|uniref:hypothetical protein n=1 Tax=Niallia sp. Krafla_26 TaxID=3064703 RepID=UPI003D179BBB
MIVNFLFHPVFALLLFVTGIWMGSMVDPLFGLITILGGMLLGASSIFENGRDMDKKIKILFIASFIFLLSLMSIAYMTITVFFLR